MVRMSYLGCAFLQLLYARLEQRTSKLVFLQQIVGRICRGDRESQELYERIRQFLSMTDQLFNPL